jgi:hypothetical protein
VPPRETGLQAAIESFNGLWQKKVWLRFSPASLAGLRKHSRNYIDASRIKHAGRTKTAPPRHPFPKAWNLDYQADPMGHMVYLRRTDDQGRLEVLGHSYLADSHWVHRLVRADVDFKAKKIRLFGLRRSQPEEQPLFSEHTCIFPKRSFRETSSRATK